jgi:hypothetical protein
MKDETAFNIMLWSGLVMLAGFWYWFFGWILGKF